VAILRSGAAINLTLILLGLTAPAVLFIIVMRNAINIPIGDEWWWVQLLYKEHTSGLQFADIWTQHNEHRVVFPTLLMLALDRFGGYNVVRELTVNVMLATLTLATFVPLIRRTMVGLTAATCVAFTSAFVFSMTQYENWMWGFQMGWFLVNFCGVLAIVILSGFRKTPEALLIAIACVFVASFSLSSGLDFWLAGAFVILSIRPIAPWRIIVWTGFAIACFALYLHGYEKPTHHPSTTALIGDPLGFVQYLLTYLGSPLALARTSLGVLPAGVAVAVSFIVVCALTFRPSIAKSARDAAVPWLSLAIFAALAALMTAIGRFGFGIEQAFAGRYVTVSSMFWIGTFGAFCALTSNGAFRFKQLRSRFAIGVVALLFVGAYAIANSTAFHAERIDKQHLLEAYTTMLDPSNSDDASLSYIFPDPNAVREWARELKQVHEGPFR
jgi:hypothetical protein